MSASNPQGISPDVQITSLRGRLNEGKLYPIACGVIEMTIAQADVVDT